MQTALGAAVVGATVTGATVTGTAVVGAAVVEATSNCRGGLRRRRRSRRRCRPNGRGAAVEPTADVPAEPVLHPRGWHHRGPGGRRCCTGVAAGAGAGPLAAGAPRVGSATGSLGLGGTEVVAGSTAAVVDGSTTAGTTTGSVAAAFWPPKRGRRTDHHGGQRQTRDQRRSDQDDRSPVDDTLGKRRVPLNLRIHACNTTLGGVRVGS